MRAEQEHGTKGAVHKAMKTMSASNAKQSRNALVISMFASACNYRRLTSYFIRQLASLSGMRQQFAVETHSDCFTFLNLTSRDIEDR